MLDSLRISWELTQDNYFIRVLINYKHLALLIMRITDKQLMVMELLLIKQLQRIGKHMVMVHLNSMQHLKLLIINKL